MLGWALLLMCTMTFLGSDGSVRLGCNRDELRTRPKAMPPRRHSFGERNALFPVDAQAGGTWIAVNDAGLMMALLNRYPDNIPAPSGPASRGELIPSLLHHASLASAVSDVESRDIARYAPFRLLLADRREVVEMVGADGELSLAAPRDFSAPLLFTSSGLGDHVVEGPRRALFDETFGPGPWSTSMQDDFHLHLWCEQPALSVRMEAPIARTVSHAFVELFEDRATMSYRDVDQSPEAAVSLELRLR